MYLALPAARLHFNGKFVFENVVDAPLILIGNNENSEIRRSYCFLYVTCTVPMIITYLSQSSSDSSVARDHHYWV